jgi:hypothetical protein
MMSTEIPSELIPFEVQGINNAVNRIVKDQGIARAFVPGINIDSYDAKSELKNALTKIRASIIKSARIKYFECVKGRAIMYNPTKKGSTAVQPGDTNGMFDFFVRAYGANGWVSFMEIVASVFVIPLFVQWDWTRKSKCEVETLYNMTFTREAGQEDCVSKIGKKAVTDSVRHLFVNYLKTFSVSFYNKNPTATQREGFHKKHGRQSWSLVKKTYTDEEKKTLVLWFKCVDDGSGVDQRTSGLGEVDACTHKLVLVAQRNGLNCNQTLGYVRSSFITITSTLEMPNGRLGQLMPPLNCPPSSTEVMYPLPLKVSCCVHVNCVTNPPLYSNITLLYPRTLIP